MQFQQATVKYSRYSYNFTDRQMRHYFYSPVMSYLRVVALGVLIFILLISTGVSSLLSGGIGFLLGIVLITIGMACLVGTTTPLLIYYFGWPIGEQYAKWADGRSQPLGRRVLQFLLGHFGRPTDEQYAKWIDERFQPLYQAALQRLHLDESQCESIIEVRGAISSLLQLTKKFPEKEIVVKRLRNGKRHFSINMCTYIFLTKDAMAIYSGYINALTQNERFEDADHYYYKDIVAVSISGPIYILSDESPEMQMQGFLVRMNNGDAVGTDYATSVRLRNGKNTVKIQGVDKVVAALLQLLHDHNVSTMEAIKVSRDIRSIGELGSARFSNDTTYR